ncbi:MAG: HD domain-containing protein [Candidatus Micrarchaeota archaeon]|nr:HD domain-containing protein [Candidatus Micrarchaeota archaeon]MDE1848035.1 HD domain-containing protein [Candidatus Micrarchaeota archaeon]MDE1864734.1 HD domain-containing protein [Candidatus Micrarchaeota archaeon]
MEEKTSFDRIIDDFLEHTIVTMTAIQRYNTKQIIKPQNVMEHEGSVAFIAMVLSDYLNAAGVKNDAEKVMRIAITHDKDEVVSGDINFIAKYRHGQLSEDLRESLDKLGDHVIRELYERIGDKELSDRYYGMYKEEKNRKSLESKIVKLADWIDVIIYARQEQALGNRGMFEAERNARESFVGLFNQITGGRE